jgi:hypothetical protein
VLIDRSHISWGLFSVALVAAGTAGHVWLRALPGGTGGGSPFGLAVGTVALAAMLFALLLGARKALVRRIGLGGLGFVPRLGSVGWWTRGHLWLGLVALPLALIHSGFRVTGSLATVLVALLVAVVATGLYGLVLQHVLPHELSSRERGQTTHEENPRRTWNLVSDGHASIKKACDEALKSAREAQVAYRTGANARAAEVAALPEGERPKRESEHAEREKVYLQIVTDNQAARDRLDRARERVDAARPETTVKKVVAPPPSPLKAKRSRASVGTRVATMPKGMLLPQAPDPSTLAVPAELVAFYVEVALPYLLEPAAQSLLRDELSSEIVFESLRLRIPEAQRAALTELRSCCDSVRRKARGRLYYRTLHSWLLVHTPLAVLLVLLALVHAILATRF